MVQLSMIRAWRDFERDTMPENISGDLKLIIEFAFFIGASVAYTLRHRRDTEADIGERLVGLAGQMKVEREKFLRTPEGKGL